MYLKDVIARSGRSLKSAKGRTILTALAIAVGGFTLNATLAASNGARSYADKLIKSNFDPSELIVGRDPQLFGNASSQKPQEYDETIGSTRFGGDSVVQIKRMSKADVDALKKNDQIESVREDYNITLQYITRAGQKKYTASGQAYNPSRRPEVKAGELPKAMLPEGKVLLPEEYITVLGFADAADAIGKKVEVHVRKPISSATALAALDQLKAAGGDVSKLPEPTFDDLKAEYTVIGVTKKPSTSLEFAVAPLLLSNEDSKNLYDYTTQGTPDYQKFVVVYAKVKNGTDETVLNKVQDSLKAQGYIVQSVKDTQKQISQVIDILQIIISIFGLITLIASVFGIVNTQYISVLERTREIGLMKALGMRKRDVSRLFIIEATWIGFLGGLIGSLLALALGTAMNPWITKKLELGAGNNLLQFNVFQMILLVAGLMLIATIAGLLPARKAAKLDPIEALRTE